MTKFRLVLAAAGLAAVTAPSAYAQKSKDTLVIATTDPFSTVDSYIQPDVEVAQFTDTVFGHLLVFDERKGTFLPELAKSWTQVDPTTIDFDLRNDVVYHSGNKFTSADVKYSIEYLLDPNVKLRFKTRYSWVKSAEVLGPYKIRLHLQHPVPTALFNLAYSFMFYDSEIHKKFADKSDYGRTSPSGTGPYRVLSVDENKGVSMERFEPAVKEFPAVFRAPVKRIRSVPAPERQTQVAKIITGEVNVLTNITEDMAKQLSANPSIEVTPTPSKRLMYITLDSAGRSKNKMFTDIRVRQAFIKAIPLEKIAKNFVAGYKIAEIPQSICFKENVGCSPSTKPLSYDPEGAKKLLAEAGYPNGVDLVFSVYEPFRTVAEAVVGEIRKVGFRATLESMPLIVYTRKRAKGELTTLLAAYPTFTQPNVENLLDFFFTGGRDYTGDPLFHQVIAKGASEFDLEKRKAIYREALDRVNQQSYIYPMIEQPLVMAHTTDVKLLDGMYSIVGVSVDDYAWK